MSLSALSTLLPIAGWDAGRASEVEFCGGADPILPTAVQDWGDRRGQSCRRWTRGVRPLGAAYRKRPADSASMPVTPRRRYEAASI